MSVYIKSIEIEKFPGLSLSAFCSTILSINTAAPDSSLHLNRQGILVVPIVALSFHFPLSSFAVGV
jgi:hypothetical protein